LIARRPSWLPIEHTANSNCYRSNFGKEEQAMAVTDNMVSNVWLFST